MTTYKDKTEAREQEVVDHFRGLIFSGLSVSEASLVVMKKFSIFSRVTVWSIRKRVEAREALKKENQ